MIKLRVIRYRDLQKLWHLEDAEDRIALYHSCVKEWDLLDEETGEPIPVEELGQLSQKQVRELCNTFLAETSVPKASAAPSPSSSAES